MPFLLYRNNASFITNKLITSSSWTVNYIFVIDAFGSLTPLPLSIFLYSIIFPKNTYIFLTSLFVWSINFIRAHWSTVKLTKGYKWCLHLSSFTFPTLNQSDAGKPSHISTFIRTLTQGTQLLSLARQTAHTYTNVTP